jgi:hypothetical protein
MGDFMRYSSSPSALSGSSGVSGAVHQLQGSPRSTLNHALSGLQ